MSLELDCDPESEADRGLGNYNLLNESHEASPAHPLKTSWLEFRPQLFPSHWLQSNPKNIGKDFAQI